MPANKPDLNNILYFVKIVEHGSLSAASEALGVAKSMLSRHLSALEDELAVRLIRRTTRKLHITDIGSRYYEHCRMILSEMDRASSMIDTARAAPRRTLRIASPLNFAQIMLAPILTAFMVEHPDIEILLDITNQELAATDRAYDLALHIGPDVRASNVIARSFTVGQELLVASPDLAARCGGPRAPADLLSMPSLAGARPPEEGERYFWYLTGPAGQQVSVPHFPRLVTEDLWMIKHSALAGCGIASMPPLLCRDALDDGRLVHLLPDWSLPVLKLQAIHHPRRGVSATADALLDFLTVHLRRDIDSALNSTWQLPLQSPPRVIP